MDKKPKVTHSTLETIDKVTISEYAKVFRMVRSDDGRDGHHLVRIVRKYDGTIWFENDSEEGFVYFYPDQVRELRRIINLPTPRKPAKRRKE